MSTTSQKSIKEMRLEATTLLTAAKAIHAKGEDATPDEVAEAAANTARARDLINGIKSTTSEDTGRAAREADEALKALFRVDPPPMGGGGEGGNGGALNRQDTRGEGFALKSLGESLVTHESYKAFNPSVQGSAMGVEFGNLYSLHGHTKTTLTTSGSTLTQYDRPPGIITLEQQRLTVADLMSSGIATANTVRYVREDTYTNAATTVTEGATKPEAAFDMSEADAPVRKIAVTAKVTDEMYQDFPQMQSYIDGRLRYMVGATEEAQLLNGDGNAPNITGILQTSGIQTQDKSTDENLDAIHKAITKVRAVGFFEPDAIVMHPTDYQLLRLSKDNNLQYYGGGPFMGPYGNGGYPQLIGPWGLRAVVTTAISAGTALVGAFKIGAMIFRKPGITMQMTNSDQDDFVKNLITLRCEERLALAIWRPKAFCTVTSIA